MREERGKEGGGGGWTDESDRANSIYGRSSLKLKVIGRREWEIEGQRDRETCWESLALLASD